MREGCRGIAIRGREVDPHPRARRSPELVRGSSTDHRETGRRRHRDRNIDPSSCTRTRARGSTRRVGRRPFGISPVTAVPVPATAAATRAAPSAATCAASWVRAVRVARPAATATVGVARPAATSTTTAAATVSVVGPKTVCARATGSSRRFSWRARHGVHTHHSAHRC
jgi:hypothetical protein